eukprot:Rhum_TRINITY_DN15605_c0_g1::Rhum_TRINITY_DN15605_c0_g1_i1::g.161629::m.161629
MAVPGFVTGIGIGATIFGLAKVATFPFYEAKMYRCKCDLQAQAPWWAAVVKEASDERLEVIRLTTADEVTYANELPWEPTPVTRTTKYVLVPERILEYESCPVDASTEVHATFETRKSLLGSFLPVDDYSNFTLRSMRSL